MNTNGEAYARSGDPGTSHAAAESMRGAEATRMESFVLEALKLESMTTHEIAASSGLPYESVTPRIKPLVAKGLVVDSGERREGRSGRKSIVWRAA